VQYFFADGDVQKGPFPIESLPAQGLKPDSLVWREGMSQWQRADSVAELAWVLQGISAAGASAGPSPAPYSQGPAAAPSYPSAPAYVPSYPAAPYSPAGAGYQPQPYYGGYTPTPPASGMAIASMIVGILSIPMTFMYCLGLPCAIVAIILGHIVRAKARRGEIEAGAGMAMAGLICGYVSILLSVIMIAFFVFFLRYSSTHPGL